MNNVYALWLSKDEYAIITARGTVDLLQMKRFRHVTYQIKPLFNSAQDVAFHIQKMIDRNRPFMPRNEYTLYVIDDLGIILKVISV